MIEGEREEVLGELRVCGRYVSIPHCGNGAKSNGGQTKMA